MNLVLRTQRAQEAIEGRPPLIEWKAADYAVVDDDKVVGRIYRQAIHGEPQWLWFLQTTPAPQLNTGMANTRDQAKAAFKARYEALCPPR